MQCLCKAIFVAKPICEGLLITVSLTFAAVSEESERGLPNLLHKIFYMSPSQVQYSLGKFSGNTRKCVKTQTKYTCSTVVLSKHKTFDLSRLTRQVNSVKTFYYLQFCSVATES